MAIHFLQKSPSKRLLKLIQLDWSQSSTVVLVSLEHYKFEREHRSTHIPSNQKNLWNNYEGNIRFLLVTSLLATWETLLQLKVPF